MMPSFPSLFNQLYDSPLDSQLWALEDSYSQILGYGGGIHHTNPVSLKKGDNTLTLFLRHPGRYLLRQMKDIPCELSLSLSDPLICNVYDQLDKASTPNLKDDGRSPLKPVLLRKGEFVSIAIIIPSLCPH